MAKFLKKNCFLVTQNYKNSAYFMHCSWIHECIYSLHTDGGKGGAKCIMLSCMNENLWAGLYDILLIIYIIFQFSANICHVEKLFLNNWMPHWHKLKRAM